MTQNIQNLDQPQIISQYAFGVSPEKIGEIAVIMKNDMTEQYRGAFDRVLCELKGGVYSGITGLVSGREVSAIYSKGPGDIADCVSFLGMCKTKCHTLLSTGSVGGLEKSMDFGDLLIADSAVGIDGYSLFLAIKKGKPVKGFFDNAVYPKGKFLSLIEDSIRKVAQNYNVHFHKGKIFTIPGVSLEDNEFLEEIAKRDCAGIDMRTSQFYTASQEYGFDSVSFSWVTDLPLTRNFFHRFHSPKEAQKDFEKKHPIWLNMANIVTNILKGYINKIQEVK